MSVNQSGIRRTVGRHEGDNVPRGVRSADLIAATYFLGLNIIAMLGEITTIFHLYGKSHPGISFLYKTLCYPSAALFSRFISLKGDDLYVWLVAEMNFIFCSFLLWFVLLFLSSILKVFKI